MNIFEEDFSFYTSFLLHDSPFSPLPEMPLPNLHNPNKRSRPDSEEDDDEDELASASASASLKKSRSSDSSDSDPTASPSTASLQAQQQQHQQQQRRLWVKTRSHEWWDRVSSPDYPEADFRRHFRMTRATFDLLCDGLAPAVAKEDTTLRTAIPVRQRVAVCLWRLATGEPLREVSKRFGLGISTCHKLVLEVCLAVKSLLMPRFLNWPDDPASSAAVSARFESISAIPDVVGAIYTTHIPIIAPKVNVADYFNRRHTERNQKTSYSVTVQGVVDPAGVFTDVCIGWPGSLSDDKVLENSALYQRGMAGLLNNKWVVGGKSYPLMDWMLVPYKQKNLSWTQHAFNSKVEEVERVAKGAFARMKARWGCLQKRTEMKLQDLPVVLGACCVLHNICEIRNEEVGPEIMPEIFDDEMVAEDGFGSVSAMQARDSIAHNLLHSGKVGANYF